PARLLHLPVLEQRGAVVEQGGHVSRLEVHRRLVIAERGFCVASALVEVSAGEEEVEVRRLTSQRDRQLLARLAELALIRQHAGGADARRERSGIPSGSFAIGGERLALAPQVVENVAQALERQRAPGREPVRPA